MLSFSASHLSPLVVVRFLKMYNIKFRLVQRKKKGSQDNIHSCAYEVAL